MKFSLHTLTLYTDSGELIKKMHCPLRKQWSELEAQPGTADRICQDCRHPVLDTAHRSDEEVAEAVRNDPHTCLKVGPGQENVTLILPEGFYIRRG